MNAVNNMYKIVQSYLIDKTRPEKFKRDYKFSDEIKMVTLLFIIASNIIMPETGAITFFCFKV